MKIGVLGTRGIPNQYGGFEEFAEKVSALWVLEGHEVLVYCEGNEATEDVLENGVRRVFVKTYQRHLRGFYLFLYDFHSTRDALTRGCDVVYHAGYQSSVLGNFFLSKRLLGKLVYNMDGLEWKRSKWSPLVRKATKVFERLAARSGATLVADNKGIQDYLSQHHNVESTLIAYGADEVICSLDVLREFGIEPGEYNILVARFEPENNIEAIVTAHVQGSRQLIVVANDSTQHYRELEAVMTSSDEIHFLGPVYDKSKLNALRHGAKLYFHGHTVGGTNPSLLEALACGCQILAHDNSFNRDVLKEHGHYWKNASDIVALLENEDSLEFRVESQLRYLRQNFSWQQVAKDHLSLFHQMVKV